MDTDALEDEFEEKRGRAEVLICEAYELGEEAEKFWDQDAYAAFAVLMRQASEKHSAVATLLMEIADTSDRESRKPSVLAPVVVLGRRHEPPR